MQVGLQSLGRKPEIQAARAEIEAAQADLAQAKVRLDQKTGIAPAAALVYDTYFRVGESVPAGSAGREPVAARRTSRSGSSFPKRWSGRCVRGSRSRSPATAARAPIAAEITFISPQAEYTPPVIYSRDSKAKLVFLVEARPAAADAAAPAARAAGGGCREPHP